MCSDNATFNVMDITVWNSSGSQTLTLDSKQQVYPALRSRPSHPNAKKWCINETALHVISGAGSRYGQLAIMAGLKSAIDRDQLFSVIAKHCDAAQSGTEVI